MVKTYIDIICRFCRLKYPGLIYNSGFTVLDSTTSSKWSQHVILRFFDIEDQEIIFCNWEKNPINLIVQDFKDTFLNKKDNFVSEEEYRILKLYSIDLPVDVQELFNEPFQHAGNL